MATVEDVLLRKGSDVITALPGETVRDAAARMAQANVGAMVVEDQDEELGIVTERDFLRRVLAEGRDADRSHVGQIMTSPLHTCRPSDSMEACGRKMAEHHIRHLAVLDDNGELVGLISLRDVLKAMH